MTLIKGYYGTANVTVTALEKNTVYSLRIKSVNRAQEEDSENNYVNVNQN